MRGNHKTENVALALAFLAVVLFSSYCYAGWSSAVSGRPLSADTVPTTAKPIGTAKAAIAYPETAVSVSGDRYVFVGDPTYTGTFGYGSGSRGTVPYLSELDKCAPDSGYTLADYLSDQDPETVGTTILAESPSQIRYGLTQVAIVGRNGNCLIAVGTLIP